ncbi:hypothetical protein T02_3073 [Trichinella nativa]|uniref:Uncharacterized protein n=1 Tax=Trichinella nativa TaxID=6335 RepID=A0A0V1LR50_9BILA|nr:hypothetical protein T02_3073 [Trichinella nativa]
MVLVLRNLPLNFVGSRKGITVELNRVELEEKGRKRDKKKEQHIRIVDGVFLLTSSTIIVGTTCVAADALVVEVVVVVDVDVESDEVGLQILPPPPPLPLSLPLPLVAVVSREDLSNWMLGFLAAYRSHISLLTNAPRKESAMKSVAFDDHAFYLEVEWKIHSYSTTSTDNAIFFTNIGGMCNMQAMAGSIYTGKFVELEGGLVFNSVLTLFDSFCDLNILVK